MREIRTSGSVGGEADDEPRRALSGHEGGNAGHRQAFAYRHRLAPLSQQHATMVAGQASSCDLTDQASSVA